MTKFSVTLFQEDNEKVIEIFSETIELVYEKIEKEYQSWFVLNCRKV